MRTLGQDRLELIDALVAEGDQRGITAGLLEKDEHLTEALRALFALKFEHAQLVLCGGTSLSKAYALIDRMSEDADIKVVLSEEAGRWPRSTLHRYLGDEVRAAVASALTAIGFVEDVDKAASRNDNRYLHSRWIYARVYEGVSSLRPNLQLELTNRTPVLASMTCSIGALADRLAGREAATFHVTAVSVAETQAEKALSFLRRFALHRAGQTRNEWDTALVRHLYDVHCIHAQHPASLVVARQAFAALVAGDTVEFERQHPDFAADPYGVLRRALVQAKADEQTRNEYALNLLPLIYGDVKPPFDEAFASFEYVAETLLA